MSKYRSANGCRSVIPITSHRTAICALAARPFAPRSPHGGSVGLQPHEIPPTRPSKNQIRGEAAPKPSRSLRAALRNQQSRVILSELGRMKCAKESRRTCGCFCPWPSNKGTTLVGPQSAHPFFEESNTRRTSAYIGCHPERAQRVEGPAVAFA